MLEVYHEDITANMEKIKRGDSVIIPVRDDDMVWKKAEMIISQEKSPESEEIRCIRSADGSKVPGVWYAKILKVIEEPPDSAGESEKYF